MSRQVLLRVTPEAGGGAIEIAVDGWLDGIELCLGRSYGALLTRNEVNQVADTLTRWLHAHDA